MQNNGEKIIVCEPKICTYAFMVRMVYLEKKVEYIKIIFLHNDDGVKKFLVFVSV